MNPDDAESFVAHGSGADMHQLRDGEADLVITGPPYFPFDLLPDLEKPLAKQKESERILERLTSYAITFRAVYGEIARVLKPGGACVIQVRDIRYGPLLLPIVTTHWDLALSQGLHLSTRIYWSQHPGALNRASPFIKKQTVGSFRADDVENFLVFCHPGGVDERDLPADTGIAAKELVNPLWRLSQPHQKDSHPWASPSEIIRRFVLLYSAPGDLVVDPFMGFGTTLTVAHELGRRAAGWDIDLTCYEKVKGALER